MARGDADAPPSLEVRGIVVRYGAVEALRGVSLAFTPGVTALLGENGAGKTTLVRTLCGLLKPVQGAVYGDGVELRRRSDWRRFSRSIGYLPQSVPVLRHMTAAQYLQYVAYLKRMDMSAARSSALSSLKDVGLEDRADMRTTKLSGGMRRRLGLAAALVGDPGVVLLDEPTVGLDPGQRIEMRRIVRAVAATRAVLISTHLAEDASALAERVVVVHQGRVAFDGSARDFARAEPGEAISSTHVEAAFQRVIGTAP
jgi:ABC-2 type transport system ATP-binding protein